MLININNIYIREKIHKVTAITKKTFSQEKP